MSTRPPAPGMRLLQPGAPKRRIVSLRWLVSVVSAGLIAGAVIAAAIVSERNTRTILVEEVQTRLVLEARNLALTSAGALLGNFPELTLQPIVRDVSARRPEIALVVVLDHQGTIQAHPDTRALGQPYAPPAGLTREATRVPLNPGETLQGGREIMLARSPVQLPDGRTIGTAIVGLKRSYLERAIDAARQRQLILLVILLGVGLAVTLGLVSHLLKPVGPLREGLERIGRGDLDTPLSVRDRTEFGLLADTVNRMAARLKVAQREALERDRLAREVELAHNIQQSILPSGRTEAGPFVVNGAQRAAAEVGGDYWDVLPLPDGRIGFAIADVSGKGLAGCLVMSMLAALLRALRGTHRSPSDLLVVLESNLVPTLSPGAFVTMFYGVLDPATGRVQYASAGHTPALVVRGATGAVEWRRCRSVPMGAIRRNVLRTMLRDEEIVLGPGDLLVQFTDGFNESMRGEQGEQFGLDRIAEVVRQKVGHGADAVITALSEAIHTWTGTETPMDDETVLVVEHRGAPVITAPAHNGHPSGSADPDVGAALGLLERARAEGSRLELVADIARLSSLRGWMQKCPDLGGLDAARMGLIESALYEMCANVIEHGLGADTTRHFELWWVPGGPTRQPFDGSEAALHARIRRGYFLLRDPGIAFKPGPWTPINFGDPSVRRRGRGIGLEMIRRILHDVSYHPGTAEGNLTILGYDPDRRVQGG